MKNTVLLTTQLCPWLEMSDELPIRGLLGKRLRNYRKWHILAAVKGVQCSKKNSQNLVPLLGNHD